MRNESMIERIALRREQEAAWARAVGEMRRSMRDHAMRLAHIGPPKPIGSRIYPRPHLFFNDGLRELRDRCYAKLREARHP